MRWQPSKKDWRCVRACAVTGNGKRLTREIWCQVMWSTLPAGRLCRRVWFSFTANISAAVKEPFRGEHLPFPKRAADTAFPGRFESKGSGAGWGTALEG